MLQAKKLLTQHIKENDVIVIGVSGGPDSMALLSLLNSNNKIICAHVNHNVRKESYDEAIMVEKYCNDHNIIFRQMVIDSYNEDNFHNQARDKRYAFYESLIKEYGAKFLLTAHHGDDLMETILMRIVRGSSLSGYAGFNEIEKRGNYYILRPLIHNTKAEILNYVIKNDIPYAIDASNEKDVYTRNRFRKYILPKLKEENKNVHDKFYDFSILLNETSLYINEVASIKIKECFNDDKLDLKKFNDYSLIIKNEILRLIFLKIYQNDISLIKNSHINSILEPKKANFQISLPKGIKMYKSYDYITFELEKTKRDYKVEIIDNVTLPNGRTLKVSKNVNDNSNNVIRLSSKDIELPLFVRNRKDGDKIILKGLNKHKKIKDILIDDKIPRSLRDDIPIVEDSAGKILWIPGIKKSKFDKSNSINCDIIIKYI